MSLANKVVTACDPHLHTIKQGLGKGGVNGVCGEVQFRVDCSVHFPFALFVWVVWFKGGGRVSVGFSNTNSENVSETFPDMF